MSKLFCDGSLGIRDFMNKKYGVLKTALFTVGSAVCVSGMAMPIESDYKGMEEYLAKKAETPPGDLGSPASVLELISSPPDNNSPIRIDNVCESAATGYLMAEFPVTVVFDGVVVIDGNLVSTQTVTFEKWPAPPVPPAPAPYTYDECGIAQGVGWSLIQCGNTWTNEWILEVSGTPIKSITIEPIMDEDDNGEECDAAAFDIITGVGLEQTPGSLNGRAITDVEQTGPDVTITAEYSRPVYGPPNPPYSPHDLYGVLTLDFSGPLSGTLTFIADTDIVTLEPFGCCCVNFDLEDFSLGGYEGDYPLYFNDSGSYTHTLPDAAGEPTGTITKYLRCYDYRYPTEADCGNALGESMSVKPEGFPLRNAEVDSTHWFEGDDMSRFRCNEIGDDGIGDIFGNMAKGVNLAANKNKDGGVDLTLTTDSEKDTAKLAILCGNELENEGTEIKEVCSFPSGGSPYTCKTVMCDNYRVLETEYDGDAIVYKSVTAK
jgi:hypothetical protein